MKKNYVSKMLKSVVNPLASTSKECKNGTTAWLVALFVFFGMSEMFGQSPFVDNNTANPNTFTVPYGVTSITIHLWGGGGAGGGSTTNSSGGSGGGSGGYTTRTFTGLLGGEVINYTLGTGGTGSTGNGTAGSASSLTFGGFTLTANGGNGGNANQGTAGTGGTASGGTTNTTGNSGIVGTTSGGNGGNAPAGGGTGGTGTTNNPGNPGNAPGGGGGGGERGGGNQAGGNGGSGGILITFTCPTFTAGSDQNLAACSTTTTLAAAALLSGTTGAWTVISGTATVTTPSSPTSGVTGIIPGTPVTLRWTVTNGSCGSSFDDVVISSPVGPGCLVYCTPTATTDDATGVTNVTFNTINNSTVGTPAYNDFTSISTSLMGTSTYPLTVRVNTAGNFTVNVRAWIDWNANGTFEAGEEYNLGSATNVTDGATTASPLNILIPNTPGTYRMRVRATYNVVPTACGNQNYSETEDYTINVFSPAPCVAPTAQPTALVLTPGGTSISGNFSPAVPAADNYLVIINTTGTVPAPVNGTTYAIGGTVGAGNTVVDIDNNTTFVATGLSTLTTYYIYIFSYNSLCSGGPLYNAVSPLNGSTTTTAAEPVYCTPSVGAGFENLTYFTNISFVGTLNDVSNNSTFSSAPRGYENFTTLPNIARQAQGEGVNISTQTTNRGYLKAWVDWNKDGDFLDAGEKVYDVGGIASYSTTFGFVIPGAQPVGNYRIRIRINKDDNVAPIDPNAISTFDACQNINYYGETEDYLFTVVASCSANITAVFDGENCGPGSVVLGATGSGSPTQYRWYTTEYGGTPVATTATGSWTTPALATTTTYWVTAFNGCESLVRTKVVATISPLATLTFTPSVPEVCGENNVLSLTATGDKQLTYLVNEPFNSGLGVMSNVNIVSNSAANNAITQWQGQTSTFVPAQQVWFPAIASGLTGNGFAMATSDVPSIITHNAIQSPIINSTNYLNLTMSFDIYYSRYYIDGSNLTLDYVTVDVSTNGGGAWTELARYTADIGYGTRFENKTFSLNGYINQSNLRVRVRYYGEWCDGLAIDNFKVFGDVPLNTSFDWTSATPVAAFQDFACTTPYVAGTPITTVYIRPTLAQLEEGTYDFTATATLSNGCDISQDISIENKSKVWKGGSSNDWNNPNNWLPLGVPDANTCVIVPSAFNTSNIIGTNYNAFGKTLQVKDGGTLIVHPSNTVTITDYVEVSPAGVNPAGVFTIENSASLIQVNNAAVNTGNITMKRNVNLRKLDYVYWSTPVANFALNSVSPGTTGFKYKWTPTIATNTNGWGNWAAANETMVIGKGYIVRGPDAYTSTLQNFTANFFGVPNNGIINMPISRGTYDGANYSTGVSTTLATKNDDNWNLIGNPYPSAVNANTFLATNTNIAGFIKYWTHGTLPSAVISDPFYNDFGQNYTVADYVTYNATGANPAIGNGNIAAGQGFFVLMNHTSAATTENVVFNNSMRRNDYRNDLFYRNENETNAGPSEEKHRIWLNLISPSAKSSTALIGYIDGATNDLDRMYDAPALDVKTNFELYSFSNTDKLTIQGKSLPFNNDDQIHLGVRIPQNGTYTIGISTVDGLFESASQDIYLEDKVLNVTHNLRSAPYSFTATAGSNETRFVLKFTNETLGNEDFTANAVTVYTNESINVNATNQTIKSVRVHDLLGRVLGTFNNVNASTFATRNVAKTQSPLLVEVTLENGAAKTYKVIF